MPSGLSSTLIHFAPLLTTTSPCGQYFFFDLFEPSKTTDDPDYADKPEKDREAQDVMAVCIAEFRGITSVSRVGAAVSDFSCAVTSPKEMNVQESLLWRDACATQTNTPTRGDKSTLLTYAG